MTIPGKGKMKRITGYPIRSVPDCGSLAHKYLFEYDKSLQAAPAVLDIEDFVTKLLELDIIQEHMKLPFIKGYVAYLPMLFDNGIRQIEIEPGTVILNENLQEDLTEWRYVLAHEAGHWTLKRERPYQTTSNYSCCKDFSERSDLLDGEKLARYYQNSPDAEEEIKADSIANALLMPTHPFLLITSDLMDQYGFDEHKIISGEYPEKEAQIISDIASTFIVPEYAVRNNLYRLGLYDTQEHNLLYLPESMMRGRMDYKVSCPCCGRSDVYADSTADIRTSYVCRKCKKAFTIDWETLTATPSEKIRRS